MEDIAVPGEMIVVHLSLEGIPHHVK